MNKSGIKRTCSFSMSDVSCCLAGEGRGNGRTYPCWMNDRTGSQRAAGSESARLFSAPRRISPLTWHSTKGCYKLEYYFIMRYVSGIFTPGPRTSRSVATFRVAAALYPTLISSMVIVQSSAGV